jgi:uncharacterized protein YbjT (DUF2867 family)
MKLLVLGASGFIGARVAAEAVRAGHEVRAGARDPQAARRRAPRLDWVEADFRRLTTIEAWTPLLKRVEAVINCVGVLQDAPGDSSHLAHVAAPRALIGACEAAGVRRLIHVSAVGADQGAGTAYARDKGATETMLAASSLDWIVVRPSLVLGREIYGGTALMRGLAGLPGLIPLTGAAGTFRPVPVTDLASWLVGLLQAEPRRTLEAVGAERVSLEEVVLAYRAWLGFGMARVVRLPAWAAWPAVTFGDLVAWLGWTSSLRSTSLRQLGWDAAGQGPPTPGLRPFSAALWDEPAGVQDRWHARLFFVRPLAIVTLGLFWLFTGLVDLGPGHAAAQEVLEQAGLGPWAGLGVVIGGGLDVLLAALLFIRRTSVLAVVAMLLVTAGYLAVASVRLPQLWFDPLGPWLKVFPMLALCLFILATDERR